MKRFICAIVLLAAIGCLDRSNKQCWDCIQSIIKYEGVKETKSSVTQEFCSSTSKAFFEEKGTYFRNLGAYSESSSVRCTLK